MNSAILDGCRLLELADQDRLVQGRALLLRIVAMLTALVLRMRNSGSGSGSDAGSG